MNKVLKIDISGSQTREMKTNLTNQIAGVSHVSIVIMLFPVKNISREILLQACTSVSNVMSYSQVLTIRFNISNYIDSFFFFREKVMKDNDFIRIVAMA